MPLPGCMGLERSSGGRSTLCFGPDCGVATRSAWSERITRDEYAKDNQQQKLRVDIPDPHFNLPPDLPQQLLDLLKEQQAATSQLLVGQRGLLVALEEQHRDLCEQLENRLGLAGTPKAALDLAKAVGEVADFKVSSQSTHNRTLRPREKKKITTVSANRASMSRGNTNTRFTKAWGASNTTVTPLSTDASYWQGLRWRLAKKLDHPYFDLFMGLIIVLNFTCVFVHLELKGMSVASRIGIIEEQKGTEIADPDKVFQLVEICFCVIYFVELMARVTLLKWQNLCTITSVADAFIVLISCVDAWILTPLASQGGGFQMARFVRLVRVSRVLRAVKVFRFMSMFKELRVMLRSFSCSISALLWSMLFISFLIVAGGVLMTQLTHTFMEDESAELELRRWVFLEFGTAARSTWSIFEATFTTGWPDKARRLVFEVNPAFALFWVLYVVVVNFAVMRVIAALFLKHTLSVSNKDEERMSMEKMQKKEAFASKIRDIFARGDKLGDGVLHQWEFEAMMQDPEVIGTFQKLDMSTNEINTLYNIMSDRDGVCDYEEFLAGALKMKNTSRTLDIIEVQHEQLILRRIVEDVHSDLKKFLTAMLGPQPPPVTDRTGGAHPQAAQHDGQAHGNRHSVHWDDDPEENLDQVSCRSPQSLSPSIQARHVEQASGFTE